MAEKETKMKYNLHKSIKNQKKFIMNTFQTPKYEKNK